MKTLLLFIIMVLSFNVQASVWYKTKPEFISVKSTPVFDCTYHWEILGYMCDFQNKNPGKGRNETVVYTNGEKDWVEQLTVVQIITCDNKICWDENNRIAGYNKGTLQSAVIMTLLGHYVIINEDDRIFSWKFGTGEFLNEFPAFITEEEYENRFLMDPVFPGDIVIDLTCYDHVTFRGNVNFCVENVNGEATYAYSKQELPFYFPLLNVAEETGEGYICKDELCTDLNDNVIGINPFHYGY